MKLRKNIINKPHKSLHPGPKRYRLTFTNENTFNTVWSVKLSRFKVWLLSIAAVAAIICLVAILVLGTPLRAILPGYLMPEERHTHINNALRLDSLQNIMNTNNVYIANLRTILTDNIPLDSIAVTDSLSATANDTLLTTSAAEKEFTHMWEERERYNLSVITPVAAKAMSFHKPVTKAMADTTADARSLMLTAPRHSGTMTIQSGLVIDVAYEPAQGYAIIIQHPNDFISRYSGMADTFVRKGDHVKGGQVIGLSNSQTTIPLTVEIWHKGTPAKPAQLLGY